MQLPLHFERQQSRGWLLLARGAQMHVCMRGTALLCQRVARVFRHCAGIMPRCTLCVG
jgi:hypothetical protein